MINTNKPPSNLQPIHHIEPDSPSGSEGQRVRGSQGKRVPVPACHRYIVFTAIPYQDYTNDKIVKNVYGTADGKGGC